MKLIDNNLIKISKAKTIHKLFEEISDILLSEGHISSKNDLIESLDERESLGSTAITRGLAITHTFSNEIVSPKIVVLKKVSIKNWKTLDDSLVDTVIAIIVPKNNKNDHLIILARMAELLNLKFSTKIKKMKSSKIIEKINEAFLNFI